MLCPIESHLSGLTSSRIRLFPPTKGDITRFTLMKQQFPQGEYPSMGEMTHFVLTPLLKSWADYLRGCSTWSILQRPCLQGAHVYANPERETPQRVFCRSPGRLCSPLPGCVSEELTRRMQWRCIIIFPWEISR